MSKRTIAKIATFVILLAAICLFVSGCGLVASGIATKQKNPDYDLPKVVGRITNTDVTESSGLAASKCQPGVFWTHNDSGDDALIYAFNLNGENLGTWRVRNAQNDDWEDIATFRDAAGKCFIYIGEIGNNSEKRDTRTIYRVGEPQVSAESRNIMRKNALLTDPAEVLNYTSQSIKLDAESLMVHPANGDIYVLTKSRELPSSVLKIKPLFGDPSVQTAERIAEIKVPSIPFGLLTGGDISPDGRRVVLCDYREGYELTLPAGDDNFDDIWRQPPVEIDLGDRDTGEAIAYGLDGRTVYATTEGKNAPLIEVRRKVN
jgi:hypothetical protein